MKTLVVYHSKTGKTRKIGKLLEKELSADSEEILDLKIRKGLIGFLKEGFAARLAKTTKIRNPTYDSSKYDLVVIGCPVWAGRVTPAIRTYLTKQKPKSVAFFFTSGGGDTRKAKSDMIELCLQAKCVADLSLSSKDLKKPEEKIKEFVKKLKS